MTAGAETARLEGHLYWVAALCVLPDGRLASGSWDNTIRLWDVTAGAVTAGLELDSVAALCMLPDGRLASGSHDNTIRLWLRVYVLRRQPRRRAEEPGIHIRVLWLPSSDFDHGGHGDAPHAAQH